MERSKIIKLLHTAETERTSDYDEETINAILEASQSDDEDLRALASLAVHNSLKAYEDDFLKNFGVYKSSQDYEDYIQELFIVIHSDLDKWIPEKGALTTHFKPRFTKACIGFRNEHHSTFSSPHYELVHADIKKAKNALEQQGVFSPTPLEIRNQIALTKKSYSEQTILNCMEQIRDVSSIESNGEIHDSMATDPINKIIEEEYKDEITRCIESLEPQHKIIMQIEYNICKQNAGEKRKVTNRLIAEEFRRIVGPASDEWIKNIRDAAERDFQHRYKTNKYRDNKQIHVTPFIESEYTQMENDIIAAIEEDIDAMFELAD